MNSKVKRYNKSFIGLMEQSNTGDWVQYEDFEELQTQNTLVLERADNSNTRLRNKIAAVQEKFLSQIEELAKANRTIYMYRCITPFLFIISVAVIAIGVYHG